MVVGERVFVLSQGILGAHDANTGKRLSRERLKNASSVTASLWAGGERLYVLNESGETTVIDVNSLDALETNKVPGLYWSTPAFSGNTILIREAGRLYCIRD